MNTYVVLIRGINVGGSNKVPMAELRSQLEKAGFTEVRTYIASGNVIVRSDLAPERIKQVVEKVLLDRFSTDQQPIKVLVLSREQLQSVVDQKPDHFGDQLGKYHSDVIFLMDIGVSEALSVFAPREGVDTIWSGTGVIYSQRLSAERTRSRLNKIIGTKPYQSMTIRTWNTVTKLLDLMATE